MTDPRTLFVSRQGLDQAKALIHGYNTGVLQNVDPERLWHAKKVVESTVHPDTGKPVFLPFRMSCFVPTNLVVVAGMLTPNASLKNIVFWQWANQSVNVAINYSNANKTTEMDLNETALAYASAVTTSCGLALGLTQMVPRLRFLSLGARNILARLVPFAAVASAGTVNVYLMRMKEIREGINFYDENGKTLGKSKIVGASAVGQVAVSRILTALPALTIPPLILTQLEKKNWFKKNPKMLIPVNFGLITLSLMTALPLAIAAFPQRGSMNVQKLEPEYRNLQSEDGKPIEKIYYNKGL